MATRYNKWGRRWPVRSWTWLRLEERRLARKAALVPVPTVPNAPTGLTLTDNFSDITVSWSPVAAVTGYKLYRKEGLSAFSFLVGVLPASHGYVDTDVLFGHAYTYYVTATNALGESTASGTASVTHGA